MPRQLQALICALAALVLSGSPVAAEQGDTEVGFRLMWVTGSATAAGIFVDTDSSPGRAGFYIVPAPADRQRVTHRAMSYRATLAVDSSGAAVPATKEAAARASSVVAILPSTSHGRAARATLGRQGRPRRPEMKEPRPRLIPRP